MCKIPPESSNPQEIEHIIVESFQIICQSAFLRLPAPSSYNIPLFCLVEYVNPSKNKNANVRAMLEQRMRSPSSCFYTAFKLSKKMSFHDTSNRTSNTSIQFEKPPTRSLRYSMIFPAVFSPFTARIPTS